MPPTLELTKRRKEKIRQMTEKAKLFLKLLKELGDAKTFKLYVSGKAAIEKGQPGIPAETFLASLHLK